MGEERYLRNSAGHFLMTGKVCPDLRGQNDIELRNGKNCGFTRMFPARIFVIAAGPRISMVCELYSSREEEASFVVEAAGDRDSSVLDLLCAQLPASPWDRVAW